MSNILDFAKAKYQEKLEQEMREIEVPEWGNEDGPLVICVKPANLTVYNKISKLAMQGTLDALVEAIILRAKDKNGLSLFSSKDKKLFMTQLDPKDVIRVGNEIISDMDLDGEEYEETVKN